MKRREGRRERKGRKGEKVLDLLNRVLSAQLNISILSVKS